MPSIEKRTNKAGETTYRVKVRLRGHPTQSATFKRRTDARKWAQQTEAAIRERRYFKSAEAEKHTLSELIDRYIDFELIKLPKVQVLVTAQLQWWKSEIGAYTLADVSPALIAEMRDKLFRHGTARKTQISSATVNRYLAALSMAYSCAVKEWGWVESSPLTKVKKLPEPRGRVRYLDREEVEQLLEACDQSANRQLKTIVLIALGTGARKMEILRLRWSDVDLEAGRVVLHETKNNERRALSLSTPTRKALKELGKVRRIDSDLVFPSSKDPQRPINIRDPWLKAVQAAGIEDFRFHDLRHTAASYLAMNGASLNEIAAILGHKTLAMVQRYAHLSSDHTASVIESMNNNLFKDVKGV